MTSLNILDLNELWRDKRGLAAINAVQYTSASFRTIARSHGRTVAWFMDSTRRSNVGNRPSISELEKILDREDEVEIEILPNGEVRAKGNTSDLERGGRKPLTMREDLGGEYAE